MVEGILQKKFVDLEQFLIWFPDFVKFKSSDTFFLQGCYFISSFFNFANQNLAKLFLQKFTVALSSQYSDQNFVASFPIIKEIFLNQFSIFDELNQFIQKIGNIASQSVIQDAFFPFFHEVLTSQPFSKPLILSLFGNILSKFSHSQVSSLIDFYLHFDPNSSVASYLYILQSIPLYFPFIKKSKNIYEKVLLPSFQFANFTVNCLAFKYSGQFIDFFEKPDLFQDFSESKDWKIQLAFLAYVPPFLTKFPGLIIKVNQFSSSTNLTLRKFSLKIISEFVQIQEKPEFVLEVVSTSLAHSSEDIRYYGMLVLQNFISVIGINSFPIQLDSFFPCLTEFQLTHSIEILLLEIIPQFQFQNFNFELVTNWINAVIHFNDYREILFIFKCFKLWLKNKSFVDYVYSFHHVLVNLLKSNIFVIRIEAGLNLVDYTSYFGFSFFENEAVPVIRSILENDLSQEIQSLSPIFEALRGKNPPQSITSSFPTYFR